MWRERQQLGGMISGVKFVLAHGSLNAGLYATAEDLEPAAVSALQLNPSVQVEMMTAPVTETQFHPPRHIGQEALGALQEFSDHLAQQADAPEIPSDAPPPAEPETPRRRGRKPKAE